MLKIATMVLMLAGATNVMAAGETDGGGGVNVYGNGNYGLAGCGLGSLLFGSKPGAVQIVAATFNGTSGNQTFGITTGTSNCGAGMFAADQMTFINSNLASLQKSAAQGEGDTLTAYATTLGCSVDHMDSFRSSMRASFNTVFATNEASDILSNTRAVIYKNEQLRGNCAKI